MNDLVQRLRKEAGRCALMQGDKETHTNRRRKTFRYRNHLFTNAADRIEALQSGDPADYKAMYQRAQAELEQARENHDLTSTFLAEATRELATVEATIAELPRHEVIKDSFSHEYIIVSCGVRNGFVVYADELDARCK